MANRRTYPTNSRSIDSDLASFEKAIEPEEVRDQNQSPRDEQPRIAWHYRKLASKYYSLYDF